MDVYKRISNKQPADPIPMETAPHMLSPRLITSGHQVRISDTHSYREIHKQQITAESVSGIRWRFGALRLNLSPTEVAYSANQPAHIRVWFGDIPEEDTLGWSNVAKQFANTRWDQAYIDANGGTADTTLAFSVTAIPENAAPTKDEDKKVEEKVLFHELGHALGLRHEHESPRTKTTDTPNRFSDMATFFDEQSVMLYPGHELKSNGPMWEQFKDFFMPSSTKYTHVPSKLDMAFLAVSSSLCIFFWLLIGRHSGCLSFPYPP
jgi:hypothetical protein